MEKVISKDGTLIAYDKTGKGTPLILIGGAMNWRTFAPIVKLAELLSPHFNVINYDRRGRGDSSDTRPYAPEREIEDLEALIQAAGGSAFVYGISSGAALAILAAANGLNIQKLVLYEPPFIGADPTEAQTPPDFLPQIQKFISENRRADAVKSFMKVVGVPGVIRLIAPLMPFWKTALTVAHTLPYDFTILKDQKVPAEALKKIKVPTLILSGGATAPKLRKAAEATARTLPGSTYQVLLKQRHDVSPEALAPAMISFLNSSKSQK
jgi:pimeloyl-ACP methyl ester carboxylesterase